MSHLTRYNWANKTETLEARYSDTKNREVATDGC